LFLHATPTSLFYTLSLHDALPIFRFLKIKIMRTYNIIGVMSGTSMDGLDIAHVGLKELSEGKWDYVINKAVTVSYDDKWRLRLRSEEHTSELQSRENLVCRLLLEK